MRRIPTFLVLMALCAVPALPVDDRYLNSNGVRIRYTDQGSGEPVILIHGSEVNQEHEWVETGVLAKLVKDYRVIALDNRGHGKSGMPHDPKAYGIEMGMDVIRLMNYLQIPKAHIVGYSMGAGITTQLLASHPERFYTATVGGGAGSHQVTTESMKALETRVAPLERGERSAQQLAMNDDPVALALVIRGGTERLWDAGKMTQVKVPVLALVGSKDPGLAGAKELQRVLPSVKLVEIEGATHAGSTGALFRPEFIGNLQDFLAAHRQKVVEDRYLSSSGVKIRYTDQGSGEPVILVHGFGVNQEHEWVLPGVLPNLARDYRVIAIDVRGFGKSDKPHDPAAYGPEQRLDIIRLMEHLQIAKAHVVGYSMGAGIVAKLLTEHPERFLTATVGGGAGRRSGTAVRPAQGNGPSPAEQLAALERGELTPDLAARSNDPYALAAMRKNTSDGGWDAGKMKDVKVPVLAVAGSNDPGLEGAQVLRSVLPSVKLMVIDGATHAGSTGALYRSEFVGAIREFLAANRQPVIEDKYFISRGVRIRYTDQGKGEPVILVHGSGVNQEHEWVATGVLPSLGKDYHVIAIDTRGHGKSDKPHDAAAYGAEMGMDVIRLMNYLQIPKTHIIGYSQGAGIVAKLVSTHQERFYTATVGGGAGRRNNAPTQASNNAVSPQQQLAAYERGELPASQALLNDDPLAMAAIRKSDMTWDETKMKQVKIPMLAVTGSNDALLAGAKDLVSVLPSVKLVVVEGATHAGDTGALYRPEFIRSILEFLAANRHPVVEDKYFTSNGVKIRYTDQGSGEPVIMVHGYSVNQEHEWVVTGVLPALVRNYRVIAIDTRGHGKSDKPHDPKAYGAEMGMDVIRLMDYLNIKQANIVGYSLGAFIAAKLVSEHPERFLTATVGGGAGRRNTAPPQTAGAAAARPTNTTPGFQPDYMQSGFLTQDHASRNNDPIALAMVLRGMADLSWDEVRMKQLRVPVLAVVGSNDNGLNGAKDLKNTLPSVKLVVIDGATHAGDTGALYRPEFIGAIRDFVAAKSRIQKEGDQ
jgi:pimeloyl-ACP methyl ester carboxylesterase